MKNNILKKYPKAVVGALLYNNTQQILLVKSPKYSDWIIPGGHIEWGESMEFALRREIKEELNLTVGQVQFIAIKEGFFYAKEKTELKRHFIFIDFLCEYIGGNITLNEELNEYQWYSFEEALQLNMTPEMIEVIVVAQKLIKKPNH